MVFPVPVSPVDCIKIEILNIENSIFPYEKSVLYEVLGVGKMTNCLLNSFRYFRPFLL